MEKANQTTFKSGLEEKPDYCLPKHVMHLILAWLKMGE